MTSLKSLSSTTMLTAISSQPESKKVVDEVSGWLRISEDGSVDRTWTGPPEALPLMEPVPPYSTPVEGITLHDLPGNPNLRLYLPEAQPGQLLPVLLHFQGGGFCVSHHSWLMYHQFYARLARTVQSAVISVELPLAPEHRLPAHIEAGNAALLRLRSIARGTTDDLASELLSNKVDFSRVFLIGDSSGGNLVHIVAAKALEEVDEFWAPVRIVGGIPLHPGFVRSTRSKSELELKANSVFFTLDMVDKFLALALPLGATKDHPYTCPMGELAPPLEKVRLPAFLVGVAEFDLIRDRNLEYYDAMKKAGKEVEVIISGGVSHSFYLNKFAVDMDPITGEKTRELVFAIKDFIERH